MRLYEAGQINQTNEVCMREVKNQTEELERLREVVNFYQRALTRQQGAVEHEKKQHAWTAQSLTHESQRHQEIAQSLEHERNQVKSFIGFLDSLQLSKTKGPTETSIGELWQERIDMKVDLVYQVEKMKYLEQELEQAQADKHHLLMELSRRGESKSKVTSPPTEVDECESMSARIMFLDGSDEEEHTLLKKSGDKLQGDDMLMVNSDEEKVSVPKRQLRKRRHG